MSVKYNMCILIYALIFIQIAYTQDQKKEMTLEYFQKTVKNKSRQPQGSLKCFMIAILEHTSKKNPDGKKMIAACMMNNEKMSKHDGLLSRFVIRKGKQVAIFLNGNKYNEYKYNYNHELSVLMELSKFDKYFARLCLKIDDERFVYVTLIKDVDDIWKVYEYSQLTTIEA